MDNFILYALIAANEAIENSGWIINNETDSSRTGVIVGSGIGGIGTFEEQHKRLLNHPKRVSPFFVPYEIINMASGRGSMLMNAKGPNFASVTACATSNNAPTLGNKFLHVVVAAARI